MLIIKEQVESGLVYLTLNRPAKRNALSEDLLAELLKVTEQIAEDESTKVVIIQGSGPVLSAGGDLTEFSSFTDYETNLANATLLARTFHALYSLPIPVITVAHKAYGGALGILAASDFLVLKTGYQIILSELKIDLLPATISPFLAARFGPYFSLVNSLLAEPINFANVPGVTITDNPEDALSELTRNLTRKSRESLIGCKALFQPPICLDKVLAQAKNLADLRAKPHIQSKMQEILQKK